MKLAENKTFFETSGDLEAASFSIKDHGMIFDILRSKMYSNPILAICREISCNARDAHREVGKFDVPVQITLPNSLEPFYKIKDEGPGISPDRMHNVFIHYAASTKRSDNVQTGGFGIGSKVPFSYSDTFTIITTVDGIKYNYGAVIDETKVGKLIPLSQSPTKDCNGTEIIIPVKAQDFKFFREWTEFATRHWDVKPIIKGTNDPNSPFQWETLEKTLEGNGWCISKNHSWNREIKAIVDGIEYPIELEALKKFTNFPLYNSLMGNILLFFNVGDLTLSANREQLQLDDATQLKIREKLIHFSQEFHRLLENKINSFTNLWDAHVYVCQDLHSIVRNYDKLNQLSWKNITLKQDPYSYNGMTFTCPVVSFTKDRYNKKLGGYLDINKRIGTSIRFELNTQLFINDVVGLSEPSPRHIKKYFEDNPNCKRIDIICPNDKVSEQDLNTTHHLDKMEPIRLSTLVGSSVKASVPRAISGPKLIVFQYNTHSNFHQVTINEMKEDKNKKVLCILDKNDIYNERRVALDNGKFLGQNTLRSIVKNLTGYSFYGVDAAIPQERIKKEFKKYQTFNSFMEDHLNAQNIDFVQLKYLSNLNYYDYDVALLTHDAYLKKHIKNPQSEALKYLNTVQKAANIVKNKTTNDILFIYELIKGEIDPKEVEKFAKTNHTFNAEKMEEDFNNKYPMIRHIVSSYAFERAREDIADYINLIDKQ